MERILALQTLSITDASSDNQLLGSDDSNNCSSESKACSALSITCFPTTNEPTNNFW